MKRTLIILLLIFAGWEAAVFLVNRSSAKVDLSVTDASLAKKAMPDTVIKDSLVVLQPLGTPDKIAVVLPAQRIHTGNIQPYQVAGFAKTLIGVPYLYGSTDPAKGFDCSGFITYVFNHFAIQVPRSSIDFTNVGTEVSAANAKEGDLILFTGTDSTEHFVGHMGIVVSNTDSLRFIHSTSGKQHGVTITALNGYYQKRYVKTVRVFL